MIDTKQLALAVIGGRVGTRDNKVYAHVSFGKIIEEFSLNYKHIYLSCPVTSDISSEQDYLLPSNVSLCPQPNWSNTLNSIFHLREIKSSYHEAIKKSDHVFIRGNPVAATTSLYKYCLNFDKPVCHWLVGNPMALLNSHKRSNKLKDTIGKLFIWKWEKELLRGRAATGGSFICNGNEIAERYATEKTIATVSTTLNNNDFYERVDTCQGDTIKILCLCYIRPEKGVEYLIEAFAKIISTHSKVKLILAGSRDRYPAYQQKLDFLIEKYGIGDSVEWLGHVKYQEIPELMKASDIFVLPTLSEGTPRVLVEARANSLPLVATNVGGIPSSVTDGFDGILVSPKNSLELEAGINKIISDSILRKKIIKNGFDRVKKFTVNNFVSQVINCFDIGDKKQ